VATQRVHEPDSSGKAAYDDAYRTYRALYENLRDMMHGKWEWR
jgi:sugar (pentulose or hexulose) kinase